MASLVEGGNTIQSKAIIMTVRFIIMMWALILILKSANNCGGFVTGNSNIVVISDPNELEKLLRAEGKHPERDKGLESNVAWLLNSMNLEVGLGFA